jgi:hypothetical protein
LSICFNFSFTFAPKVLAKLTHEPQAQKAVPVSLILQLQILEEGIRHPCTIGQGVGVGDRGGSGETGAVIYPHEGGLTRLLWHDKMADGLFSPGSP